MREDAYSSANRDTGEAGNAATEGAFSTAMNEAGSALSGAMFVTDDDNSLSNSEGTTTMGSGCVGCKVLADNPGGGSTTNTLADVTGVGPGVGNPGTR